MTHLFLFQIGPVQAFIAQARRTQDLTMGSAILSQLAGAGVLAAADADDSFRPVFPVIEGRRGQWEVPAGVPHRFCFLSDVEPQAMAARVHEAVTAAWNEKFAKPVKDYLDEKGIGGIQDIRESSEPEEPREPKWRQQFDKQLEDWLEFYWVALPYDVVDHKWVYRAASHALAQRKALRHYPRLTAQTGLKCSMTGMQSALNLDWTALRGIFPASQQEMVFRPNERLGSLALVKRLAGRSEVGTGYGRKVHSTRAIAADNPAATEEPSDRKDVLGYMVVLHMDGDSMGPHISDQRSLKAHQDLSRRLRQFAEQAGEVVAKYGGNTGTFVYSGGDDVLALLPLKHALGCALALRDQFLKTVKVTTISAGLAITPENLPLDMALEMSRKAEKHAKEGGDGKKDAIAITEAHGSGQLRTARARWDTLPYLLQLQGLFEREIISGKLAFDLLEFDQYLFKDKEQVEDVLQAARIAELKRIVGRRTDEKWASAVKATLQEQEPLPQPSLTVTGEVETVINVVAFMIKHVEEQKQLTWTEMAHWVMLVRFLAQGSRADIQNQTKTKAGA